jgi:MFS family permease
MSKIRCKALMITNVLALVSSGLSILTIPVQALWPFLVARLLNGFMCGSFNCVASVYLMEISPRHLKGSIGTLYNIALEAGIVCTSVFGLPSIFGTAALWLYLYIISMVPFLINLICLPFCVETPKYVFTYRNDSESVEKSTKNEPNAFYSSYFWLKFCLG